MHTFYQMKLTYQVSQHAQLHVALVAEWRTCIFLPLEQYSKVENRS